MGLLTALTLLLSASVAEAGTYTGKSPYDYGGTCSRSREVALSASPWLAGGGTQYGGIWAELRRSRPCQTAWGYIRGTGDWSGEISVWNPGKPSQRAWSTRTGNETLMIDQRPGLEACYGVQVYYRGSWNRWLFLGCVSN